MQKLLLSAAAVTLPFFGYEHATSISSPSADPTYLTTEIWMPSPSGANVCSGKSTGHGAIQYGVCGQNNATSSEMISCPDVKHLCIHNFLPLIVLVVRSQNSILTRREVAPISFLPMLLLRTVNSSRFRGLQMPLLIYLLPSWECGRAPRAVVEHFYIRVVVDVVALGRRI